MRTKRNLYVVSEYCRHGDVEHMMKKKKHLTEVEAVDLLVQTITGLNLLHNENMWHRDIKPANIIINNGSYKICDYGLSSVAIQNPKAM